MFAKAIVSGLTLTLVDFAPSRRSFEAAMVKYLKANTDRACKITRSSVLDDQFGDPIGYEFFYECEAQ